MGRDVLEQRLPGVVHHEDLQRFATIHPAHHHLDAAPQGLERLKLRVVEDLAHVIGNRLVGRSQVLLLLRVVVHHVWRDDASDQFVDAARRRRRWRFGRSRLAAEQALDVGSAFVDGSRSGRACGRRRRTEGRRGPLEQCRIPQFPAQPAQPGEQFHAGEQAIRMEVVDAGKLELDGGLAEIQREPRREAGEHLVEVVDVYPERLALAQGAAAMAAEAAENEDPKGRLRVRP